jgi:hypothetical protein
MHLVPEDRCIVCGHLHALTREAYRLTIEELPLDEPVCFKCWEALGESCGWFSPRATMH